MQEDDDLDDWIAGLSGKRPARGPGDDAAILRAAVLAEQAQAAREQGIADDVPPLAPELVARMRQALVAEGLLPPEPPKESNDKLKLRMHTPKVRRASRARVWAMAASVALLSISLGVAVQFHLIPGLGDDPEFRGVAGVLRLTSAAPTTLAATVESELLAIGLASKRLPAPKEDPAAIVIQVKITAAQRGAFDAWMVQRGGVARAPGEYHILISAAPANP